MNKLLLILAITSTTCGLLALSHENTQRETIETTCDQAALDREALEIGAYEITCEELEEMQHAN